MPEDSRTPKSLVVAFVVLLLGLGGLAAAGVGSSAPAGADGDGEAQGGDEEAQGESLVAFARENPGALRRKLPIAVIREKLDRGKEAERESRSGPSQQRVDERAYPRTFVADADAKAGRAAYTSKPSRLAAGDFKRGAAGTRAAAPLAAAWQELGPVTPLVPAEVTYTGAPTENSGRTTAMLVSPTCGQPGRGCRLWIGAAGGGVWRTADATAPKPVWQEVNTGLPSLAIGSLTTDPSDPTGNTLYAGTGEPNASSDSEAGLGVFKSTDGGDRWTALTGSQAGVATDRSVASIVVDPTNPRHLWIGTAVARHGTSASNGGRRTPPNAPPLGIYETKDGGSTFTPVLQVTGDNDLDIHAAADGRDLFNGGVNKMMLDPQNPSMLYSAFFGYGIYRLPGSGPPEQVFATKYPFDSVDPSVTPDSGGDRTEFDLVVANGKTRMYAGDTSEDNAYGALWRTDDISLPSAQLVQPGTATTNAANGAPWINQSSPSLTKPDGTFDPAFVSYGFCEQQCTYDSFVVADKANPNTVYLGGSMNYDEIFGSPDVTPGRTNGRAVIRSVDAGATFTDMTNDTTSPPTGMHPDQHTLAVNPANPGQMFVGSDGGMIRSNGTFTNDSAKCARRGLAGAELALCRQALKSVPTKLQSISDGLATLQFQGVSFNPKNPLGDVIGGTQDNGTWGYSGSPTWTESIGGDGGNSAIASDGSYRVHTYYGPSQDVNYNGNNPNTWLYISEPLDEATADEQFSFYVPEIADPVAPKTLFTAGEYVWRTTDAGGNPADLRAHCLETAFAIGDGTQVCGDWQRVGGIKAGRLADQDGANFIVALARAPSDRGTLWSGRRRGGLFLSSNADAADPDDVQFTDITGNSPDRFVSGIAVDPANPNHAWVSYSGYSQYTSAGKDQGHVFEVTYDPASKKASWVDRSYDIGKAPVTAIARDDGTGDLYAANDFGVLRLPLGATAWEKAAGGLPVVAVYGMSLSSSGRVLYAATHGRGVFRVTLGAATNPIGTGAGDTPGEPPPNGGPTTTTVTTTTTTPAPPPPPPVPAKPGKLTFTRVKVRSAKASGGRRKVRITFTASRGAKVTLRISKRGATLRVIRRTVKAGAFTTTITVPRRRITRKTRWTLSLVSGPASKKVTFRP